MAPQRRAGSRSPEGAGAEAARAEERRRLSSVIRGSCQKDPHQKWLKVGLLLSSVVLGCLLSGSYLFSEEGVTEVLGHYGEIIEDRFIEVACSEDYDSHKRFEGCTPRKCGRGITDAIISRVEAERIRRIAEKGLSLGGSDGGLPKKQLQIA